MGKYHQQKRGLKRECTRLRGEAAEGACQQGKRCVGGLPSDECEAQGHPWELRRSLGRIDLSLRYVFTAYMYSTSHLHRHNFHIGLVKRKETAIFLLSVC